MLKSTLYVLVHSVLCNSYGNWDIINNSKSASSYFYIWEVYYLVLINRFIRLYASYRHKDRHIKQYSKLFRSAIRADYLIGYDKQN